MSQFIKVLKYELKGYFTNKVFIGVTLFFALAIIVVLFFPQIKEMFVSADNDESSELPIMVVTGEQADVAGEAFSASFTGYEVRVLPDANIDDLSRQITSGEIECAFVLNGLDSYTYYVNNLSMYDVNTTVADELLGSVYRYSEMVESGLTPEQASGIMSAQVVHETVSLGKDQMQNFFYTYIMVLALYMVIIIYGQMVATNVASEKSSRAMEVLITSVKPTSMMFGKIMASCIAGLVQIAAIFGTAFVCYGVNSGYWEGNAIVASIFDMPADLLAYMLLFFVLGFLMFAFMYGAIGSMASKLEDINTSVMPVTMLCVVGFMVVMISMSSGSVDNTLMTVCSFVPFTSPMAMFCRIAMGTVPFYEIAIAVALLVLGVAAVGVFSAKVYRVGVLLYGNKPKIGSILKNMLKA